MTGIGMPSIHNNIPATHIAFQLMQATFWCSHNTLPASEVPSVPHLDSGATSPIYEVYLSYSHRCQSGVVSKKTDGRRAGASPLPTAIATVRPIEQVT